MQNMMWGEPELARCHCSLRTCATVGIGCHVFEFVHLQQCPRQCPAFSEACPVYSTVLMSQTVATDSFTPVSAQSL